jgi:hypothetical protein
MRVKKQLFLFLMVWAMFDCLYFTYICFSKENAFAETDTLGLDFNAADTSINYVKTYTSDSNIVVPPGKELLPLSSKRKAFALFDTTQSCTRVLTNEAFKVGEKLVFNIRYGVIVAGSATMSIPETSLINNFECFHITTEAKSNSFFSAFYTVKDQVHSFLDRHGLYSWRFEKHIREGKYRSDQLVEYNHLARTAITIRTNLKTKKVQRDTLRIPPCVQDVLSTFYYIRTIPLEVGKSIFIDNQSDRKLYPLEIKVHKKEKISVKAGTFNCIIVEPMLRTDAIFKQRGRLLIWLTDDNRRIPVQMKSKIIVGSITAELIAMKGTMPLKQNVQL